MDEINYQLTIVNNHCKFNTFINVWLAGTSPLAPWRLANHCHLGSLVGGWALPLRKMMESLGMMTFPIWWESHKIPWFQTTNQMIHHDLLHVFFFAIHHDSSSLAYSIPILGMGSVPKKTSTNHGACRDSAPPSKEKDLCCRACGKKVGWSGMPRAEWANHWIIIIINIE